MRIDLLTGTHGCYLTTFPIWGRLTPDPDSGATLDGAPIVWLVGTTGERLADGNVVVRVPGQGSLGGEFVATSGNDYWLENGPDPRSDGAVAAFPACSIAPADPRRLQGGGVAFAAQRAGDWIRRQHEELVLRNIQFVWCDIAPTPAWCDSVRREDGGPVVSRIEDQALRIGVRDGTPADVAEQLCRDVAADENVLPDGWVGARNLTQHVYVQVVVEAGPDGPFTTPTGIEWFRGGTKIAECSVPTAS